MSTAARRAAPSSRAAGAIPRRLDRSRPRTEPAAAAIIVVTKRTWGAFTNTDLERQLKARGVTQVVIAGVATSTGVEVDRASGL